MSAIPVICDRCRATGLAGEADFTHLGNLLLFDPVPRKTKRADGWTPERQRAFIAALTVTGSKCQAAHAIGMAPYGIDQMLKSDGSDSFRAAYDRAMEIASVNGSMRIASGVADIAARNAQLGPQPSRLRGLPVPDDDETAMSEDDSLALLEKLFDKFVRKVAAEREARLAGKIVAADFCLRQISFFEVTIDLMAEGLGLDAWHMLGDLRRGGHGILDIAQTPLSRALDTARREQWAAMGQPERPEHPPIRYLEHDKNFSIEPLEYGYGGEEGDKQRALYAQRHADDAAAQAEWEAKFSSPADAPDALDELRRLVAENESAESTAEHRLSGGEPSNFRDDDAHTPEEGASQFCRDRERSLSGGEASNAMDEKETAAVAAYREGLKADGWTEDADGNLWSPERES